MKNILIIPILMALLYSCDCNRTCECNECERAITFVFEMEGANGYNTSDLSSIMLRRFVRGTSRMVETTNLHLDTTNMRFNDLPNCGSKPGFSIVESRHFGYTSFDQFDYEIVIPRVNSFMVRDINIHGHGRGSRCCACFYVDKKTIELNGELVDLTRKDGVEQYVRLVK